MALSRTLLACLCLAVLPGARAERVLLVSVDGLRPDALPILGDAGAPTFRRLIREGASTGNARTDPDHTVTLPNHTGMVTGRRVMGEQGHHWTHNDDPFPGVTLHRNRAAYVASLFDVAHDHGLRTGLFAGKSKFSIFDTSYNERHGAPDATGEDNGRDKIDLYVHQEDSAELVTTFLAADAASPFDLAVLHFRDPDSIGHKHGWDLTPGSPYLQSIQAVDAQLARILDAPDAGPRWLLVTADHGGGTSTTGHGDHTLADNYTIPFLVWGPGVAAGQDLYALNPQTRQDPGQAQPGHDAPRSPIRNADAANLALGLLGLGPVPGSHLNPAQDLTPR